MILYVIQHDDADMDFKDFERMGASDVFLETINALVKQSDMPPSFR